MRPWLTSGRLSRGLTAQRLLIQGPAVQLLLKTTSAETAEHVGIQKLKQFHMVNIKTEFPRGISDQVISPRVATASARRAPDSGQELGKVQPWDREATPSSKPQAPSQTKTSLSSESLKHQATSVKS